MSEIIASRRGFLKAGAALSLAALAACSTPAIISAPSDGRDQTDATLGLINALRKDKGLPTLKRDPAAVSAALGQADRMAKAGKMAHLLGISDSFYDRMKGHGVVLPAAENIAAGQETAARAYDAWFRSPKHLANMLGRNYTGIGVAVMTNSASGNRPYWAMVLSAG